MRADYADLEIGADCWREHLRRALSGGFGHRALHPLRLHRIVGADVADNLRREVRKAGGN